MAFLIVQILSVVMAGWVAYDAAQRGRSWYVWSRLAFFGGIFGLIAWIVVRRRSPVASEGPGPFRSALLALAGLPLLAFALLASSFIVTFLFQVVRIEGQAMAPTLQNQERAIVNKLAYRMGEPAVGDVVMHYYPVDPTRAFVKRIVAGPDDVIRSESGRVFRNNVALADDFIPAEYRSTDTWGPTRIPRGYFFVMGDHRNNSSDSRSWGLVPRRYILGRVARLWR